MHADALPFPHGPKHRAVTLAGALVAALALLILWFTFTCYYVVEADEEAVVLRLGRYVRTSEPGLHYKLPFGIDEAVVVIKRVQEEEFGFRTKAAGVVTEYELPRGAEEVSLMLTGDLNCAVVRWIVRYKVKDSKAYALNVRHVEETIRDVAEYAMRRIAGDHSVDEVIGLERESIALQARGEIQEILDSYGCGIHVDAVKLKDAMPPEPVKPAFNAVNEARQNKDRVINEAEGVRNSRIPAARGQKEQAVQEAEGYAVKVRNEALGDIARFEAILEEYRSSAEVTRRRMYLETMGKTLPNVERIYIVDEKQRSILPLLQLQREEGRP